MDRPENTENQPDTADSAPLAIGVPLSDDAMRERVSAAFELREAFARLSLEYQAGLDEVLTKINILRAEFEHLHEYSPIEHVTTRLKSPKSIMKKMRRKGDVLTLGNVRECVRDIAGIRIVCSFIQDTYKVAEALMKQQDVNVLEIKDYIKGSKTNGYQSLHLIVEIPVFLSHEVVKVPVEVQIRTIAMDFWASLEHKIYYKFDTEIPDFLREGLLEAAETAARLDRQMEEIHTEVRQLRPPSPSRKFSVADDYIIPTADDIDELLKE